MTSKNTFLTYRRVLKLLALASLLNVLGVSAADRAALSAPLAEQAPLMAVTRAGTRLVAVGDYGVILTSSDGTRWQQAVVPVDVPLTATTFVDEKEGWAVGHAGLVLHSSDSGQHWSIQSRIEGAPVLLSVWFENAKHGIVVGAYGHAYDTLDGGHTWKKIKIGEGHDADLHLNAIVAAADGTLFLAAEGGGAFRSSDAGASWARLNTNVRGSLWSGVTLKNGSVLLFGMTGRILVSQDSGKSWKVANSGTQEALTAATVTSDGHIVIVGNGGVMTSATAQELVFTASVRPDRQNLAAVANAPNGNQMIVFGQQGIKKITYKP
jgi:photosystem II stability/assembly factor-like uncharacterized protein